MSQAPRTTQPLDVLQSMVNAILIETGKAFRFSSKEGGKSLGSARSRLSTTLPSTVENFHQALDELECDILRAKSVLLRDLEALQAKRFALENPAPIIEEVEAVPDPELNGESASEDITQDSTIKEEVTQPISPEKQPANGTVDPSSTEDPAKEDVAKVEEDVKEKQGATPPPSNDTISQLVGLGIITEGAANEPAPGTAEPENSAVDSLFDIPENENAGDTEMNFENMDFSLQDSNQDSLQAQPLEFDLSTFGANTQDFSMTSMQPDANTANDGNNPNKQVEDLFGTDNAGEIMDLDIDDMDFGTAGAEDSLFLESMFPAGDDGVFGSGEEMQHGDFDNDFFGINND